MAAILIYIYQLRHFVYATHCLRRLAWNFPIHVYNNLIWFITQIKVLHKLFADVNKIPIFSIT